MKINVLETISGSANYNRWIYNNIKPFLSGDVLDVGSGIGNIAGYYAGNDAVKIISLTDNSDEMLKRLKNKFFSSPVHSIRKLDICADIKDINMIAGRADTITCINVLEHIDIEKALQNMHKLLNTRGRLIIIVPALPFIYGSLDKLVGHNSRFAKKTLNRHLEKAGFFIKKQYYFNFWGIITWFLAGRVLKTKKFGAQTCKILDKLVPFLEFSEKYNNPFIGQSLLTVCYKDNRNSS